jgi:SNF2 family DNA or RNA helicase
VQIAGRHDDDHKEAAYEGFGDGSIRVLITKPKIGAWGLNWQHCNHVVTFASHSYEQYYQSVRRCWRFGQTKPVTVDIIASEGEVRVKENMARKSAQADKMFSELVLHMNNALHQKREIKTITHNLPEWL